MFRLFLLVVLLTVIKYPLEIEFTLRFVLTIKTEIDV